MFTLDVAYALRTTVLAPEFITGRLVAVQLYDHLYDEVVDTVLSISLDTWITLLPVAWPPPDFTISAGLANASLALVSGIVGGVGEQLLLAAGITFGVAVGLNSQ